MAKPVTTRPAADARTRVAHSGVTPADKRALIENRLATFGEHPSGLGLSGHFIALCR